jgi:hypothetical protein
MHLSSTWLLRCCRALHAAANPWTVGTVELHALAVAARSDLQPLLQVSSFNSVHSALALAPQQWRGIAAKYVLYQGMGIIAEQQLVKQQRVISGDEREISCL